MIKITITISVLVLLSCCHSACQTNGSTISEKGDTAFTLLPTVEGIKPARKLFSMGTSPLSVAKVTTVPAFTDTLDSAFLSPVPEIILSPTALFPVVSPIFNESRLSGVKVTTIPIKTSITSTFLPLSTVSEIFPSPTATFPIAEVVAKGTGLLTFVSLMQNYRIIIVEEGGELREWGGSCNSGRKFSWSPDGLKLACSDGNSIFMVGIDGTGKIRLTSGSYPVWSPDNNKIAFQTSHNGSFGIGVIDVDGTNRRLLVEGSRCNRFPSWSPDSKRIVFASCYGDTSDIFVINVDGTGLINLTNHTTIDTMPSWSPDGRRIAFARRLDAGNYEIYVMEPDGTGQTNLTNHPGNDRYPAWSLDGKKIAFMSDRPENSPSVYVIPKGGNPDIFVMDANGLNLTRITDNGIYDLFPTWKP